MTDCIFCKIVSKEVSSIGVYEDDTVYAFPDIRPVNLGHILVVPKAHYPNLYEIPDEALGKMFVAAKKIAITAKKTVGANGINIQMNNDPAAGQVIYHAHIHVIPRFIDDGFTHWKGTDRSAAEVAAVAEKIKNGLK